MVDWVKNVPRKVGLSLDITGVCRIPCGSWAGHQSMNGRDRDSLGRLRAQKHEAGQLEGPPVRLSDKGTQPNLTCTQALKTLKSVKGSPWSLSSGLRAVAQSRLLWALRVNGDWTLRAAAMVSTGSARLNMEPRISIFPVGSRGGAKPRDSRLSALRHSGALLLLPSPLLTKSRGNQTCQCKPTS